MYRFLILILLTSFLCAQIPAFKGAEGKGKYANGFRGNAPGETTIYLVTNTNDSGAGSFREGVQNQTGPRIIVFTVGGMWDFTTDINIRRDSVYIAGQTAPGDGVCFRTGRLVVASVREVVMRGLRTRPGVKAASGISGDNILGIQLATNTQDANNVIIDHCSVSWSVDILVESRGMVDSCTVQYCLLAQPLNNSVHPSGAHSKAMNFTTDDSVRHISIIKNIISASGDRNPKFDDGPVLVANNVIDNFGARGLNIQTDAKADVIANLFVRGTDTAGASPEIDLSSPTAIMDVYVRDNYSATKYPYAATGVEWDSLTGNASDAYETTTRQAIHDVELLSTSDLLPYLAPRVGALHPVRDSTDTDIINGIVAGTLAIIDSIGPDGDDIWETYDTGTADTDTDSDGMPDWAEIRWGYDPNVADANQDADGDGRLNIEDWLDWFYYPDEEEQEGFTHSNGYPTRKGF